MRVDSRAALLEGGLSGPAIVPGDVDASLLVEAVRYGDGLQMPPNGKLTGGEIALFEEWVRRGAVFPDSASSDVAAPSGPVAAKASELWALKPLRDEAPPTPRESCRAARAFALGSFPARRRGSRSGP